MERQSAAGAGGRFPLTRHTWVLATRSADPATRRAAWERLVESYWQAVYKYLRMRWQKAREDAEDLTQDFFARALEGALDRYDPVQGRFRTFLRTCLDRFVLNQGRAAGRLKRGGGAVLALDFAGAEQELGQRAQGPAAELDPEEAFHREWLRSLLGHAVAALAQSYQASGKTAHLRLFEIYHLDGPGAPDRPTYSRLAEDLGLTTIQVTNYLAAARRDLRRLVLAELRRLTASDEEFRAEARQLLGAEPP